MITHTILMFGLKHSNDSQPKLVEDFLYFDIILFCKRRAQLLTYFISPGGYTTNVKLNQYVHISRQATRSVSQ